jgi:multidrug efflux pump subunit AcrA (membrane-fusion protein)
MAKIYATDFVEVRLPLADRQLAYLNLPLTSRGRLPESQRPRVTLEADYAGQRHTWSGEIIRTESEIDLKSRMVNVVARIDNNAQPAPLNVGMYVEADIQGVLVNDVVVLPRNTLRNGNQVLVIDDENRLHFRTVELLRLYQDEVLIKSGLEANERVCTTTIQTVVDGMLVDPLIEPPITGPAGDDKG